MWPEAIARVTRQTSALSSFYPRSPLYQLQEIKIVKSAAANTDLYGGVTRWYRCPNGHTYGVGDCGQLNAGGTCNECGASIGGPGYH